jgi:hypothetical protein
MKQRKFTAIECLDILLLGVISFDSELSRSKYKEALLKALKIEKDQIAEAYWDGVINWDSEKDSYYSDQYYDKTFGS